MATYGILDLAVASSLTEPVLALRRPQATCLYPDPVPPEIRGVAPHLVDLEALPALKSTWQQQGLGQNWGIIVSARASIGVLKDHLRPLCEALLPETNEPVLFRFWDPRVLRTFLPIATPEQLQQIFARGLETIWVEDEAPGALLQYRFERTAGLSLHRLAV